MSELQPTAAPVRGFLDWPVATDLPNGRRTLRSSESSTASRMHTTRARTTRRARRMPSVCVRIRFSDGREQWDFDLGAPLGAAMPRCIDIGNVAWSGGSYDDYSAAISARARHLWKQGAQIFALGGDHG